MHGELPGEWKTDHPLVREFMTTIAPIFAGDAPLEDRLARARPIFERLLLTDGWLEAHFQCSDPQGGMGSGIGNWLLYRAEDESLALFSLVVDPGQSTPVHDHLRWGLIGLYRGRQRERFYRRVDDRGRLVLVQERECSRGDIYELIPPEGDIHSITTISDEPSISIHLLGGDIGCLWRHRYDLEHGIAVPFRSGYSNAPCRDAAPGS
jgi:predicted metal-dependent enzyme (double-stranded beta helix superfamily)